MSCYNIGPIYILTCLPEYTIVASTTAIEEGESVTFTINTVNIPNGTVLFYSLTGVSGSITDSDFTQSNLVSQLNPITINNNTATFTVTTNTDGITEGTEVFRALLITDCNNTQVAFSQSISINEVPVATLRSQFSWNTGANSFDFHTAVWRDNLLAVAHDKILDATQTPTATESVGGMIIDTDGTGTLSDIAKLESTSLFSDNTYLDGRSISWSKDYILINYTIYKYISSTNQVIRVDDPVFADDINTQRYGYNALRYGGGNTHNVVMVDNRITDIRNNNGNVELRDVLNEEWRTEDYGGWFLGSVSGDVHPTEKLAVGGMNGSFRWETFPSANDPPSVLFSSVTIPTHTQGDINQVRFMQFTADGKFLIIGVDSGVTNQPEQQDSSILVYECSFSNGTPTFTLRGHPQVDPVPNTDNNNLYDVSEFLITVGNRLIKAGYNFYNLSESGVLTRNQDLTDYFYGGSPYSPAELEITNGNQNINLNSIFINEDDSRIAVLVDNIFISNGPNYEGGVYIFDIN